MCGNAGVMSARPDDRFKQPFRNQAEPVEIWRARQFIEHHSGEEISLLKVAKAVNISRTHLSEKFRQVTGINFVDYIARARFEKARALKDKDELRIRDIAFPPRLQTLSQFNRVIKKLEGKSPSAYRARRSGRTRRQ
jgi:AraC-like DNA-binding protein